MEFERKHIRLPAERYRGLKRVFLTFCCDHRRPYFSNPNSADWVFPGTGAGALIGRARVVRNAGPHARVHRGYRRNL